MIDTCYSWFAALCLLAFASYSAEPIPGQLDQLFARWNTTHTPGAAVVVVKDGKVAYLQGYGCANLEHRIPITPDTVFDAASVAKQFTGLAIAMLVEQGKLSPDDDIRKHLPEVPDFGPPITISHLLHHTSGLRDWPETLTVAGKGMGDRIDFDTILEMVRCQRELDFPPGEAYSYSNTGYNLPAAALAKVTGQSFRAWMQANLLPATRDETNAHLRRSRRNRPGPGRILRSRGRHGLSTRGQPVGGSRVELLDDYRAGHGELAAEL